MKAYLDHKASQEGRVPDSLAWLQQASRPVVLIPTSVFSAGPATLTESRRGSLELAAVESQDGNRPGSKTSDPDGGPGGVGGGAGGVAGVVGVAALGSEAPADEVDGEVPF